MYKINFFVDMINNQRPTESQKSNKLKVQTNYYHFYYTARNSNNKLLQCQENLLNLFNKKMFNKAVSKIGLIIKNKQAKYENYKYKIHNELFEYLII